MSEAHPEILIEDFCLKTLPDLNRTKKVLGKVTKHGSTENRLGIVIFSEYQQKKWI